MPTFRTAAVVLRAYNFSEADQVVVLFTQAAGKVRAVAKGVRRNRSRLAACMSLLSLSELQLHGREHNELLLVTQGQLQSAFPILKTNLKALGQAARIAELVDALTSEGQALPEIFDLLHQALQALETGISAEHVGLWFEIILLDRLGYCPRLHDCQGCGARGGDLFYLPETGGVLCRTCCHGEGIALNPGMRRMYEMLQNLPIARLPRIRVQWEQARTLGQLLNAAIQIQVGRSLKSDVFRDAVAKLQN